MGNCIEVSIVGVEGAVSHWLEMELNPISLISLRWDHVGCFGHEDSQSHIGDFGGKGKVLKGCCYRS